MFLKSFIFAMVLLAPLCAAHIGGQQLALQDVNPRIYCGRALARMIAAICYDEPSIDKRSDATSMFGPMIPPYYKEQDTHIGWPWMSSSKARALGFNHSKRSASRGVADECCDKPCSINELLEYC